MAMLPVLFGYLLLLWAVESFYVSRWREILDGDSRRVAFPLADRRARRAGSTALWLYGFLVLFGVIPVGGRTFVPA